MCYLSAKTLTDIQQTLTEMTRHCLFCCLLSLYLKIFQMKKTMACYIGEKKIGCLIIHYYMSYHIVFPSMLNNIVKYHLDISQRLRITRYKKIQYTFFPCVFHVFTLEFILISNKMKHYDRTKNIYLNVAFNLQEDENAQRSRLNFIRKY